MEKHPVASPHEGEKKRTMRPPKEEVPILLVCSVENAHNVYLGSCIKIDADTALKKARRLKADA